MTANLVFQQALLVAEGERASEQAFLPDSPRHLEFESAKACSKGEQVVEGGSIFASIKLIVRSLALIRGLFFSAGFVFFSPVGESLEIWGDVRPQKLQPKSEREWGPSEACGRRIKNLPKLRLLREFVPSSTPKIIRKHAESVSLFSSEEIAAGAFREALRNGLLANDGVYNYLISPDGRLLISPHYAVLSKDRIYISDHATMNRQYEMHSGDHLPIGGQIHVFHGRLVQINQKSVFSIGVRSHLTEAGEKFKSWGLEFSEAAARFIESDSASATNSSFRGNEEEALMLYAIYRDDELSKVYAEVKALHAQLVDRMPSPFILGKMATEALTEIRPEDPRGGEEWMYFVHSLQDRGLHVYVWEMRENLEELRERMQALREFARIP